jgi:hypothetical protein
VAESVEGGREYRQGVSLFARRVQQRALDEIRKQTTLLVGDLYEAPRPSPPPASTSHDAACQMATTGRLDETCPRCRAVLNIAGS